MLKEMLLAFVMLSLLAGCGGSGNSIGDSETLDGGDSSDDDSDSDSDSDSDEETVETGVSYIPHSFLHSGEEYGFATDAFILDGADPLIYHYLITPINSQTLENIDTAETDDYLTEIDGVAIDAAESYPMLQEVLSEIVTLSTAIVIDTSASMDSVDKAQLIQGVKDFITAAQADSNETISGQEFSIWAFGSGDEYLNCTGSVTQENIVNLAEFSTDSSTLESALDILQTNWSANTYGRTSALYNAVVKAIGTYTGDGSYNVCEGGVYAYSSDGDNDLTDFATIDELHLTNIVLISAGNSNSGGFDENALEAALNWQAQVVYDADSDDYETSLLGKPLFYLAIDGNTDSNVESNAEAIITVASDGSYDFSTDLVSAQADSISTRTRGGDYYVYRYAFVPRDGEHDRSFAAQTDYYSYTLSGTIDLTDGSYANVRTPEEELSSLVEITGANNQYLANSRVNISELTTLYPATRWTPTEYSAINYSWTVDGVSRSANSNGAITISSSDVGSVVVLTNTSLSQTASLTIVE